MDQEKVSIYIFEDIEFEKLKAINKRLYDDRSLSGDQRRDLANAMEYILSNSTKEDV